MIIVIIIITTAIITTIQMIKTEANSEEKERGRLREQ